MMSTTCAYEGVKFYSQTLASADEESVSGAIAADYMELQQLEQDMTRQLVELEIGKGKEEKKVLERWRRLVKAAGEHETLEQVLQHE